MGVWPSHSNVYVPLCAFPSAYQIITLGMKVSRLCLLLLVIGLTYSTWSKFHCVFSWLSREGEGEEGRL